MARQMGGNTVIMAGSITLTTIAAAVTMPLILIAAS
jgi:predicted permease